MNFLPIAWIRPRNLFILATLLVCGACTRQKDAEGILIQENGFAPIGEFADARRPDSFYRITSGLFSGPLKVEHLRNGVLYDQDGWASASIEKDGKDVVIRYFDSTGGPVDANGFHEMRLSPGREGTIEARFLDQSGKAVRNIVDRAWKLRYKFQKGQQEVSLHDRAGEPVASFSHGYFLVREKRGEDGRLLERTFSGLDGKPVNERWEQFHKEIVSVVPGAKVQRLSVQTDTEGKPVAGNRKCSNELTTWDGPFLVDRSCQDSDAKATVYLPGSFQSGAHRMAQQYDSSGRLIAILLQNAEGKQVNNANGISAIKFTYDSKGFEHTKAYFDQDGKPIVNQDAGFHREESDFDPSYRALRIAYFDADGKPMSLKFRSEYGVPLEGAWHETKNTYESKGRLSSFAYFAVDGKPTAAPSGAHRTEYEYDATGNRISEALFGLDGKPVAHLKEGWHRLRAKYDERRHLSELGYFGIDDKPFDGVAGPHRIQIKMSPHGVFLEASIFDASGKASIFKGSGYHHRVAKINEQDEIIEEAFFDAEGKPTMPHERDFHIIRTEYNSRGDLSKESYFGKDGAPSHPERLTVQYQTFKYATDGQRSGVAYFDKDGKPAMDGLGTHRREWTFDEKGNLKHSASYDANGTLVFQNNF